MAKPKFEGWERVCELCYIVKWEGGKPKGIHSSRVTKGTPVQYLEPFDGVQMKLRAAKFCPNCGRDLRPDSKKTRR
jgi:hypothetical protein